MMLEPNIEIRHKVAEAALAAVAAAVAAAEAFEANST
jgi:hypothetical protein